MRILNLIIKREFLAKVRNKSFIVMTFLSPLLFWILGAFGWRALFFVVGIAGVLFGLFWWLSYREPHESRTVNQAELDYVAAGG